MKLIGLVVVAGLLSGYALAEERPQADKETIAELKEYCMEVAAEEDIDQSKMKKFILKCINAELADEGYKPIKSVD